MRKSFSNNKKSTHLRLSFSTVGLFMFTISQFALSSFILNSPTSRKRVCYSIIHKTKIFRSKQHPTNPKMAPMTVVSSSLGVLFASDFSDTYDYNSIEAAALDATENRRRSKRLRTRDTNDQLDPISPDLMISMDQMKNTPVTSDYDLELSKYNLGQQTRVVTPDNILSTQQVKNEKFEPIVGSDENHERFFTKRKLLYDDNDGYIDLHIPPEEFRPSASLTTGQCFNWRAVIDETGMDNSNPNTSSSPSAWGIHNATEWIGVLRVSKPYFYPTPDANAMENGSSSSTLNLANDDSSTCPIVLAIRQTSTSTLYKILYAPSHVDVRKFLYSYFHIVKGYPGNNTDVQNVSLSSLYEEWSSQCSRLKQIACCIPGVRILNQDPWECFVSFLCSSNNNIPRITKMLQSIRANYGEEIFIDNNNMKTTDETTTNVKYYSFPSLKRLLEKANENDLRHICGMGYRAKYLMKSMILLDSLGGEEYLHQLKYHVNDPIQVQESLLQFMGVGRKVGDCIALFSLNQDDTIPVDVHVWNIARRDYDDTKRTLNHAKSLTPTIYKHVGDQFRIRFPNKSGWAHSLLFVAELPSFRNVLPENILKDMDRVSF